MAGLALALGEEHEEKAVAAVALAPVAAVALGPEVVKEEEEAVAAVATVALGPEVVKEEVEEETVAEVALAPVAALALGPEIVKEEEEAALAAAEEVEPFFTFLILTAERTFPAFLSFLSFCLLMISFCKWLW